MELVLAGVFGRQVGGRALEVAGELGQPVDVAPDRLWGIIPQLQVVNQPLSQGESWEAP